jgi:hypothetical protein
VNRAYPRLVPSASISVAYLSGLNLARSTSVNLSKKRIPTSIQCGFHPYQILVWKASANATKGSVIHQVDTTRSNITTIIAIAADLTMRAEDNNSSPRRKWNLGILSDSQTDEVPGKKY